MFDKDSLEKLNALKNTLPKEQEKARKSPALSMDYVPLINANVSKKADTSRKKNNNQPHFAELFLKEGHPTVEEAFKRLRNEVVTLRKKGVELVRVIHGYGSSGLGGEIKRRIPFELELLVNDGRIESFISGEMFNCFNSKAVDLVSRFKILKKDPDYRFENPGMTIIVL